nr:S41 family peptidase [Pedobacter panaciterrae]
MIKKRLIYVLYCVLTVCTLVYGSCKKAIIKEENQNSVAVFDYLWNVMETRYAMFTYKQVDWKKIYSEYRPMVSEKTSSRELFSICSTMLDHLKDGHVALITIEQKYAYDGYYTGYSHNFNYTLLKQKYLGEVNTQGILTYKLIDKFGYLYIPSFGNELIPSDIDLVFSKLEQVEALIIDVRDNSGGASDKVDQIVKKLIQKKTLLKYDVYKKGPGHDEVYEQKPKYLNSKSSIYSLKPIIVLTNRRCFSSCNDFVLYLSELPNVVVIGDQTGGGGGTPFDHELPNGWVLKYSASYAISPSGLNIEEGISPDFFITNSMDDENKGNDAIFSFAINYLSKNHWL